MENPENIPEVSMLNAIDIAFLPMNLPYAMAPEMVADAAKLFQPKVLYPYHTGETDLAKLTALMKDQKGIEVRIRKMQQLLPRYLSVQLHDSLTAGPGH